MEKAVRMFVGTLAVDSDGEEGREEDEAVKRAKKVFVRKLGDLEHDIACVKRAVHELAEGEPGAGLSSAFPAADQSGPSVGGQGTGQSWGQLAAGLFAPSRSSSPAPAPTFGSVMTTPRLRRAPSSGYMHSQAQGQAHAHPFPSSHPHTRTPSTDDTQASPFAALDLRIPMPAWHPTPVSPNSPNRNGFGVGAGGPGVRQRTTSGMYMLGLGMRNSNIAGTRGPGSSSSLSLGGHGRSASLVSVSRQGSTMGSSRPAMMRKGSSGIGAKTVEVEESEGSSGSEKLGDSDVE